MFHRLIRPELFALLAFFLGGAEPLLRAQEKAKPTTIEGTTLQWLGGKKYEPLGKVDIVVSRGGGVVANPEAKGKRQGWVSAAKGRFEIKFRAGEPVVVLFHFDDKHVPQVQMLAAEPGQRHSVSPAMIPVKTWLAMEKKGEAGVPLRTMIQAAVRAIPKDCGEDLAKKLRKDFSTILDSSPGRTSLLVPAYFDPATPAGKGYWQQMEKSAKKVPIVAIANPNSGPGSPAEQRVYLPVLRSARRAGVTLIGYVFTDHARRPLDAVKKDITTWKRLYGREVSGIFLDAQASEMKRLPYYRALTSHIRKEFAPAALVIGNPGTSFDEEFLAEAVNSAACFYENGTATQFADLKPPAFLELGLWPQAGVLAYKVAKRQDMESLVKELTKSEAGYVYVTDAHLNNGVLNPWSRLPSWWKEEVELVAAGNKSGNEEILRAK